MITHKGLPVAGYREQTEERVQLVNKFKELEERVLRELDALAMCGDVDHRWLAIGRTDLEKAFMSINRSVFRPSRVILQKDTTE